MAAYLVLYMAVSSVRACETIPSISFSTRAPASPSLFSCAVHLSGVYDPRMPRLNVSMLTSHLGRSDASRSLRGVYLAVFSASVSWRDSSPVVWSRELHDQETPPPPAYCPCVRAFALYYPFRVFFLHFQLYISQFV